MPASSSTGYTRAYHNGHSCASRVSGTAGLSKRAFYQQLEHKGAHSARHEYPVWAFLLLLVVPFPCFLHTTQ